MSNILIIDDDKKLTDLLEDFLSSYNFNTIAKNNPIDGFNYIEDKNNSVDLIVLDVMMPDIDGFELLKKIRRNHSIPVIMLSARGDVTDKIIGLELGTDDYMSKPFEPRELLARIQSILRRVQSDAAVVEKIEYEGLQIDKLKQLVVLDGEKISLSTTEFEALLIFIENPGETLDREYLVSNLRGIEWQSYDRSIDVLVSRLRQKLGETPSNNRFIKTIHGIGYKFIGNKKD